MSDEPEEWRAIPGHEGYEVSNHGNVMSRKRSQPVRLLPFVVLGYARVRLSVERRTMTFFVHRLVLSAFVGPCPPGHETAHWNGVRLDNRLSNLRWATKAENGADRSRHGSNRHSLGMRQWNHIMTPENVAEVRARHAAGEGTGDLAREYGMQPKSMWKVVTRKLWKDVP